MTKRIQGSKMEEKIIEKIPLKLLRQAKGKFAKRNSSMPSAPYD